MLDSISVGINRIFPFVTMRLYKFMYATVPIEILFMNVSVVIQRQIYDSGFDNERSSDNLDVIAKYDMNNNIFWKRIVYM